MGKSLQKIANELKENEKKVQLIYAFNGTGKTRLSKEFQKLICNTDSTPEETENFKRKFLYYNAYTEDLFYWDNDLENHSEPKLKIQPNEFTNWVLKDQGAENDIITNFQTYIDSKLTPKFNNGNKDIPAYSEVTFSFQKGDDTNSENIKISKGEESLFIWCVFYSLFEQVIQVLNIPEEEDRETSQFDDLEYVFIDDPVTSLDENHLIELAVSLAELIKNSESDLKFIITTHNPLFYNVLFNEFKNSRKCLLTKDENGKYELNCQKDDSPFSYHLYLKEQLEKAVETGEIYKYHFNYLRNILEKTSTFLGREKWSDLLPQDQEAGEDKQNKYESRLINISSHSKHSSEEVYAVTENDKRVFKHLIETINKIYDIKIYDKKSGDQ